MDIRIWMIIGFSMLAVGGTVFTNVAGETLFAFIPDVFLLPFMWGGVIFAYIGGVIIRYAALYIEEWGID